MNSSMHPMDQAIQEAEAAAREDEVPVGAVILKDGLVIASARNAREKLQSPSAHAEMIAIEMAAKKLGSWRLEGCELFVTLEPCPMCLAAAQQARIGSIVYGAQDPKGGALALGYKLHEDSRTNHRFEVRFEPDERCGKILTDFFKKKRKNVIT